MSRTRETPAASNRASSMSHKSRTVSHESHTSTSDTAGSSCPECGENLGWKNPATRCLTCGRAYCRACPDYRGGWMTTRCPDCESGRGKII